MRCRRAPRTGSLGAVLAAVLLAGCGDPVEVASPAGVYSFDRAAYALSLVGDEREPAPEAPIADGGEARAEAVARARREAAQLDVRLALEADGSFVVRFRFGKEEGSYRGSWAQQGERITLVTTHAPGGPLGSATTTFARYSQGRLRFEAGAVPRPFELRRE